MKSMRNQPLLRWFLLLWVILVYLWGDLTALSGFVSVGALPFAHVGSLSVVKQANSPPALLVFTLLMALYALLLWLSLSEKMDQRFSWLYFLVQGLLVFAIGFVLPLANVSFSLYLALALGATSMLKRVRSILIVASGYSLLFIVSILFSAGGTLSLSWLTFWSSTNYIALILFLTGFLLLYVQQARSQAQLTTAHEKLAAYAMRVEELTRLTERQRLARDLHDTLAQGLAGVVMQLEVANSHLLHQRTTRGQELVQESLESARATLVGARCAIDDLRAETSDPERFAARIQAEVRRFINATGIACWTNLAALAELPAALFEPVVCTITEGLHNIARHASAQQIWIGAKREGQMITITVRDDGRGFHLASAVEQAGHYGLLGLQERARLAGGQLEITSALGQGTTLRLLLPIHRGGISHEEHGHTITYPGC